ncbi:MAG: Mfa1 fimbrilin C-terminal domain-containing protein, partial [Porphyromonadaceae bacterium]|nr:Mfa1 fimbrilin C-terminal domain-containing protein [Porphyromonadaceae bacterium]
SEGHLPIKVTLEASLARVLVYGNPQLNGGRKGNTPARYVVSNLLNDVAPLRPLGKLVSGQDELVGDQSLKANRYASSSVWAQWQESKPQNTRGIGHFTPELYAMDNLWTSVAMTVDAYKTRLGEANLYVKESVIPPTAYLKGTVPCVILSYPYIPRGITLTDGEGWVSFRGAFYSETRFKSFITSQKYPTDALKEAVNKAAITLESFKQAFDKEGIRYYHQGVNYYIIYIKHFGQSTSAKAPGLYGVVRGNEYRIKLLSISEVGAPVPPIFADNLDEISESSFTGISTGTVAIVERDQSVQL